MILVQTADGAYTLWLSLILCGVGLAVVYNNWKKKK